MDRPLRILHLTGPAAAGGLTGYLVDLAAAHVRAGHDVLVAGHDGAWADRFGEAGVTFHELPGGPAISGFGRDVRGLRARLRGWRPDVVHTHYRRATLLARWLGLGVPVLYTLHLSHMPTGGLRRLLADWGDHVHVASADARDWLIERGVSAERITLIPHGVDLDRFKPATDRRAVRESLGVGGDSPVAAYVGRLEHPKNVGWLPDALARNHAKLLVAGDGPDRHLLEGHANVTLLGEVDPLPVYQAADLLLLPSEREGFGLVAAEALACGTPVLRTRTSGTTETIVENETGYSTPIGRREFGTTAQEVLTFYGDLAGMRDRCAAFARANLDHAVQAARTLDLYRDLVTRHHA